MTVHQVSLRGSVEGRSGKGKEGEGPEIRCIEPNKKRRESGNNKSELFVYPPTDGGGFRDFYHNWTNSILQQLKRFWKITDVLFRIS
jgi:hypothetical protein